MPSIEHLAPHHLLTRGSHINIMYRLENIVFVCNDCHTGIHAKKPTVMVKLTNYIWTKYGTHHKCDLLELERSLPPLKHQNIKQHLQQLIEELG
jgi:hypothetical protein